MLSSRGSSLPRDTLQHDYPQDIVSPLLTMSNCHLIELCVSSRTQGEPGNNRQGANDQCLMKVRKSQDGKRVLDGELRAISFPQTDKCPPHNQKAQDGLS